MEPLEDFSYIPKVERRFDLDWLRMISIVLVFFYHSSLIFASLDDQWIIANAETSIHIERCMTLGTGLILPLFFVIAGMSTFYALNYVKAGKYTLLRAIRLLVPFFIGIFTHIPLQVFLYAKNNIDINYPGTFFQFYKEELFHGIFGFGGAFPILGNHLWFLIILFVFSLILIGPFILLRREKSYNRLLNVTSFLAKPGVIFTFVLPVILVEQIHTHYGTPLGLLGGYTFTTYILFYFFGFLFASNEKFKKSIEKQIIPALIGVVAFGVSMLVLIYVGVYGKPYWDPVYWVLYPIYGWCLVILTLGLGSKFLNKNNKARKFSNELVMPFFILHQTVIVVIGFYVVELALPMIVEYLIIVSSSLAIIIILLLIIKYLNPLRVLFGMRWKKGLLQRKPKVEATSQSADTSQIPEEKIEQ
ncbi:MAG: acyltransferase [Asgard group archaeon]|nr:acyltransferase [Asgard group archaeon]